jgi:hypothetical protein
MRRSQFFAARSVAYNGRENTSAAVRTFWRSMGIRFSCPNGHKLHVKSFLAGKRAVCPQCGTKVVIPLEEKIQPPVQTEPTDVVRAASGRSSVVTGNSRFEAASPSIVISVMDSSVATNGPAIAPAPVVTASPPATAAEPQITQPPPVVNPVSNPLPVAAPTMAQEIAAPTPFAPEAVGPVSPAARYVARRERLKRNQFLFAVMLLVAVVVLAGVLIFVLQRGTGTDPAAMKVTGTSRLQLRQSPSEAVVSNRLFTAPRALVAIS